MKLPKVGYQEYAWEPRERYALPEKRFLETQLPYKAAVLQPIAGIQFDIGKDVKEGYLDTLESIVRFDTMLETKPIVMPAILLRSESASSSQIERLTASAKNIGIAELGGKTKDNADLVASNIRAMKTALGFTGDISKESMLAIHRTLLEQGNAEIAGKFRDEQVWIGGDGYSPHRADYVPPHHTNVDGYLDDFVEFSNRWDVPPLILAAVAHAQFETIHPFSDGNGRTGRALIQIILHNKGITRKASLPISAGFLGRPKEYYAALEIYRSGDFAPIVRELLLGIDTAVQASWETIGSIEGLMEKWGGLIAARKDSVVWKLADGLLEQPVIDAKYVKERFGIADTPARNAIEKLLEAGIVKPIKDRKRNVMYEAGEVTSIMDSFGASISRRRH
jgi:Fic family protein